MNSEAKVGLLFFVGLALALWFVLFVTELNSGEGAYEIRFKRVMSLRAGDPVTYNGVTVGSVASVAPVLTADGESRIAVRFDIDEQMQAAVLISPSSQFRVVQGLFGGGTLAVSHNGPGTGIDPTQLMTREGEEPVTIDDALRQISALLGENRPALKEAIAKLPTAIGNLSGMSDEIRGMVSENSEAIGEAVVGIKELTGSVKELVDANKETITKSVDHFGKLVDEVRTLIAANSDDVRKAVARLPEAVDSFAKVGAQLDGMLTDNREKIDGIIQDIAGFTPQLKKIGTDVQAITEQIASGQGTIGKAVFDETLYTETTEAIAAVEARAEEVADFTSSFATLKLYGGVEGGYNARSGVASGTAYLRFEPKPWKFYAGGLSWRSLPEWYDDEPDYLNEFLFNSQLINPTFAYGYYLYQREEFAREQDDFDSDTANSLFPFLGIGYRFFPHDGWETYRLTAAAGLIDGQPGAWVDGVIYDSLSLSLMARRADTSTFPNGRQREYGTIYGRATLNWRPMERIRFTLGADDLFYKPGLYAGLRIEVLDSDLSNLISAAGLF